MTPGTLRRLLAALGATAVRATAACLVTARIASRLIATHSAAWLITGCATASCVMAVCSSPTFAGTASTPSPGVKPAATQQSGGSNPSGTVKPQDKKQDRRRAPLAGFDIPAPAGATSTRASAGASRGGADSPIILLAPSRARLLGGSPLGSPLFQWQARAEEGPFSIEILDEKSAQVLQETADGHEFTPGQGVGDLAPGKTYAWSVSLTSPTGRQRSAYAFIEVVSPEERAEIEKALAAQGGGGSYDALLARARLYRDRRIWYDAIGAYSKLIKKFADRPVLYEERGQIYSQIEDTRSLAEQDFSTADALSKPGG